MANIKTTAVTTTVVIKAVLFSGAAQASLRGPVSFQDYVVSGYFADDYIGVRQAYEVPAALVKYILLRADSSLDLRGLNFGVHDSTIVLDQTQFDLFKGLADALVLVDSAAINTGPGVADAVAATDSFERTVQFARLLADVSAITDSFAASTDKPFADAFASADAFAASAVKALLDSVGTTDAWALSAGKGIADSATFTDSAARSVAKSLADAFAAADAGLVTSQSYVDFTYFATDYVGDSRTF